MKRLSAFAIILGLIAISTSYYACEKNANDRSALNIVDDGSLLSLSAQQYNQFITENPPVKGTPEAAMVENVSARVVSGVEQYLAEIGRSEVVNNYQWEFNLVNNAEANAWCLPGGKIVVYSGILDLAGSDSELAVVIGHEVAHAVLKHGNERMSQQILVQYGGEALSVLMSSKPGEMQQLFNTVYGLGSTLGTLAYSRKQETEADEAGLYYMAIGKYNPNAAVTFWEKMKAQGGAAPPEFLSTHPSHGTRIDDIKSHLPKAMEYYNKTP